MSRLEIALSDLRSTVGNEGIPRDIALLPHLAKTEGFVSYIPPLLGMQPVADATPDVEDNSATQGFRGFLGAIKGHGVGFAKLDTGIFEEYLLGIKWVCD